MAEQAYKTEGGTKYFRSDFAYTPPGPPSDWKLRLVSTPGGKPDPRIVGAAVAALGKGFRGQKVQIPRADLPAVKRRVLRAWRAANPHATLDDTPVVLRVTAGIATVLEGVAPPGWEKSVKKMKKDADIDNPFALSWWLKRRGAKPAKDEDAADAVFEANVHAARQLEAAGGLPDVFYAAARGEPWAQVTLLGADVFPLQVERRP